MYVLQRNDGQYVTPLGSKHSYTADVLKARRFKTIQEAEREKCSNETIVEFASLIYNPQHE